MSSVFRGPTNIPTGPVGPVSSDSGIGAVVAGALSLVAMGISVWAIVCAARIMIGAISLLLFAQVPALFASLILSGIAGAFAGLAVAVIRSWPRKSGKLQESFVSSTFNKSLTDPNSVGVFLLRVLIGGLIGFAVGSLNGGGGILSFPQIASGSGEVILNSETPIAMLIGGGFGGPGGTGILSLLFLILVIIFAAILVGLLAGILFHLFLYALGGMIKGGTKALVTNALQERVGYPSGQVPHAFESGMVRGAFVGLIVGIIESIFTTWGVIRFYK